MYVNKILEKKTGRILLCYAVSERVNGKSTTRNVERIGYVDELEREYPDPVAHFREEARRITKERREAERKVTVTIACDQLMPFDEYGRYDTLKSLGSVFLMRLMHSLGLEALFRKLGQRHGFRFSLFEVMKLLVYQRVLDPDSKRGDYEARGRYFEKMGFGLNDVYRALGYMCQEKAEVVRHLDRRVRQDWGRRPGLMYYDVTNYYFEIENPDGFRMKGCSKEHRPLPIVQMGLFMDDKGLPVSYRLYEGNTNDCSTLIPSMRDVREDLGLEHIIIVADKGMYAGDNIARIILDHNGYVISQSVRRAPEAVRKVVYDDEGYVCMDCHGKVLGEGADKAEVCFKYKSWDTVGEIAVTDARGVKRKASVGRKRIIFWSRKYAERSKLDRAEALEKAVEKVGSRSKDKIDNRHGANKYLRTRVTDAGGNEVDGYGARIEFDAERLDEDEMADGYYIIETNVRGLRDSGDEGHAGRLAGRESLWLEDEGMLLLNRSVSDMDIIDMYRGLWRIEESFRITKSEFDARPIYLSRRDRIEGHFLICFISLLLVRLMQGELEKIGKPHGYASIVESLRKCCVSDMDGTNYLLVYYDQVIADLKDALGISGIQRVISKGEMRSICASAKACK